MDMVAEFDPRRQRISVLQLPRFGVWMAYAGKLVNYLSKQIY
jgi:hypothetical protein